MLIKLFGLFRCTFVNLLKHYIVNLWIVFSIILLLVNYQITPEYHIISLWRPRATMSLCRIKQLLSIDMAISCEHYFKQISLLTHVAKSFQRLRKLLYFEEKQTFHFRRACSALMSHAQQDQGNLIKNIKGLFWFHVDKANHRKEH